MGRDFIAQRKERFGGNWREDPELRVITPESALLEEVRRSAAMCRFLEERIGTWTLAPTDADALQEWMTRPTRAKIPEFDTRPSISPQVTDAAEDFEGYLPPLSIISPKTGLTSFTDAHTWLHLYREERGHLARVSKMCIDAGVAQRMVSIAEDQGRILSSAIRTVLQALNLSPQQQLLVPQIVPQVLRAVAEDRPPVITTLPEPEPTA